MKKKMERQEEGKIVCICGIHDVVLYILLGLSSYPTCDTCWQGESQWKKDDFGAWQQFRNIDTDITVNYIVLSNRKLPSLGLLVPENEHRDLVGVSWKVKLKGKKSMVEIWNNNCDCQLWKMWRKFVSFVKCFNLNRTSIDGFSARMAHTSIIDCMLFHCVTRFSFLSFSHSTDGKEMRKSQEKGAKFE